MQEARALWPDTPIDVFVSVGTGSTPIHRRDRGLSSFVDAGSILLESSTDVERVHEALATMTPLMPGLKYFRFNPEDARCGMELDEINPEKWALLEAATDEYIEAHGEQFDRAAAALGGGQALSRAMPGSEQNGAPRLTLGVRKGLLVVCSPLATEPAALDVAAAACSRLQTCSATLDLSRVGASASTRAPGSHQRREAHKLRQNAKLTTPPTSPEPYATPSRASAQANPAASTAPASPAVPAVVEVDVSSALSSIMGWFSPTRKGPEPQALEFQNGTTDASLDGQAQQAQQGAVQAPPPSPASHPLTLDRTSPSAKSVTGEEQLHQQHAPVDPVHLLESAILDATPGVGIVHMGLRSCTQGIVLRWRETTSAVTVPSK